MSNHTPRPITENHKKWLDTLDVDIDHGKVFNAKGIEVGSVNPTHGYVIVQTTINGTNTNFKRFHIVWWKATGSWPVSQIDHKDRVKTHDWFDNLREVTSQQNAANNGKTNGLPVGVAKFKNKYQAYKYESNKKVHLGYFNSPEEAAKARQEHIPVT